jgi:hypothetical protein
MSRLVSFLLLMDRYVRLLDASIAADLVGCEFMKRRYERGGKMLFTPLLIWTKPAQKERIASRTRATVAT